MLLIVSLGSQSLVIHVFLHNIVTPLLMFASLSEAEKAIMRMLNMMATVVENIVIFAHNPPPPQRP